MAKYKVIFIPEGDDWWSVRIEGTVNNCVVVFKLKGRFENLALRLALDNNTFSTLFFLYILT